MPPARGLSLLLLFVLSVGLRAQTFFEHLTRADGLPGDQVLALHEDHDGFIWIGTESGLARYEGVRIRTWYHDRKDPHSLSNNVVWDITEDENGRVWIATDHGLCAYDARTGGFDRLFISQAYNDPTSANRIHQLAADGHGRLWLSTEDGVHTVSVSGPPAQIPLPTDGARIGRLTRRQSAGLASDTLRDGLWINGSEGLVFFDLKAGVFRASSNEASFSCLNDTLAQDVRPDGEGGIWYFTTGTKELIHADKSGRVVFKEVITTTTDKLVNPQFIELDKTGTLWLSTWSQELRTLNVRTGAWLNIAHDERLPWSIVNSNAKSWLQDRDGRIWLGTYSGADILDPANSGMHQFLIGAASEAPFLTLMLPIDTNTVLIGTDGAGVIELDRSTGKQACLSYEEPTDHPSNIPAMNHVRCMAAFGEDWLIGTHYGLLRLNAAFTRLERPAELVRAQPNLGRGGITFIMNDLDGDTWIGKWQGGLYKVGSAGRADYFDSIAPAPLPSRYLLSSVNGPDGMWIGFNNGAGASLIRHDSIVSRVLNEPDATGANYGVVNSLALDTDGTLFMGTVMGGLGVRDATSGAILWYTHSDGLSGDRIEQLVLDRGSGLWIRTEDGLSRFDRRTHAIDHIEPPASTSAVGRLGAIALDIDGSLLCAYGPLLIDMPTTSATHTNGPELVLTSLRYAGRSLASWESDSIIELEHDARALTIECGTRGFFQGQGIRFAYRVVDIDTNWSNLGSSSRLDLNDLPVGEHRVQLRANNGGSAWTPEPLSLAVRVLPPFWSTWWFRGALLLGIGAALYFFVRGYVNERLREQRERLEREQAVLAERMRIAGDMHDDLGAGLSALKLRSEMALRVEKDPAKREQLGALANTAGELIGSMRQIIWTMNTDQSSLADLVSYTTNYTRSYCEQNGLTPEIITAKEWPAVQLTSEQRRNTFLVVKEALHNVVKHANARTVRLVMSHGDAHLLVDVQDDGIGLPGHTQDSVGNGLRNMRKRIQALGGTLGTESSMGLPGDLMGTRIRFSVPLDRADGNKGSIGARDIAADLRPR